MSDHGSGTWPPGHVVATRLGAIRSWGRPESGVYNAVVKRVFDVTVAVLLFPVLAIATALLAPLLKADGGPVFFAQHRLGRCGRTFRMWKFRTMSVDAERRLTEHLAADPVARAEWQRSQKLRNDPRITPLGRFLRRTSLDELPQLWNVIRGEMSLVGPRPMLPCQRPDYPGRDYFRLRPGITGFWQISARNESTFACRAAYDSQYAERLSFGTDCVILLYTIRPILRATGH